MTSPSVTQSNANTSAFPGGNTFAPTMPSFTTTDTIFCVIGVDKNSSTTVLVSDVTSSGLTFVKRKEFTNTIGGIPYTVSVWTAKLGSGGGTGSLSAQAATITYSTTPDGSIAHFFGVKGAASNNPVSFDINAGLPVIDFNAGGAPNCIVSTTQADDLLLGVNFGNDASHNGIPSAMTVIQSDQTWPTNKIILTTAYLSVSAVQTSVSFTNALGGTGVNELMIDAITADIVPSHMQAYMTGG